MTTLTARPFLVLAAICAIVAVGASVWWAYGGEPAAAIIVSYGSLAATGLLAFLSGFRGEHQQWNVSPLVRGLLTALIAVVAGFLGIVIANFRSETGDASPASYAAHHVATATAFVSYVSSKRRK